MLIKLYHLKRLGILGMLAFTCLISCKSERNVTPAETTTRNVSLERFLSVAYGVASTDISYNAKTDTYVVLGKVSISKTDAEAQYVKANEYKHKYEGQ